MKANFTVLGLSVSLLMSVQANAKNQQVYDADSLDSSNASAKKCSGLVDCLLRMGTFSSEKYANRYKEHLSKKTKRPVKVERDREDKNIFHVIVGPFNDFATMIKSSAELSGKTIKNTTRATTTTSKKVTSKSVKVVNNTGSAAVNTFAMPTMFKKSNSHVKSTKGKNKRTIARSGSKSSVAKPYQTKHQKILASQADYPIHQAPKTDAKGNVTPLFEAGPYLGLSAGVIIDVGKTPEAVAYQGFNGIVSAGAGHMFSRRFYMAGEFFYGSDIKAKSYQAGINGYSLDNGWFYGGSFLPGYMINDSVLAFLRIGGMRNQFYARPSADINSYPVRSQFTRRVTTVHNGFQIGAGAQTNLYKNLDIRTEYDFSYYHGIYGKRINQSLKANVSQINLGLVYKFPDSLRRA